MQRVPRLVAPALAVLALAGGTQALGAVPRFHHGLSKAQVLRTARASSRVIVVLKAQQRGRPASAWRVKARSTVPAPHPRPRTARSAASGGAAPRQEPAPPSSPAASAASASE